MTFTMNELLDAAASLFDGESLVQPYERNEYQRGVCELIGRLQSIRKGCFTDEAAIKAGKKITKRLNDQ